MKAAKGNNIKIYHNSCIHCFLSLSSSLPGPGPTDLGTVKLLKIPN